MSTSAASLSTALVPYYGSAAAAATTDASSPPTVRSRTAVPGQSLLETLPTTLIQHILSFLAPVGFSRAAFTCVSRTCQLITYDYELTVGVLRENFPFMKVLLDHSSLAAIKDHREQLVALQKILGLMGKMTSVLWRTDNLNSLLYYYFNFDEKQYYLTNVDGLLKKIGQIYPGTIWLYAVLYEPALLEFIRSIPVDEVIKNIVYFHAVLGNNQPFIDQFEGEVGVLAMQGVLNRSSYPYNFEEIGHLLDKCRRLELSLDITAPFSSAIENGHIDFAERLCMSGHRFKHVKILQEVFELYHIRDLVLKERVERQKPMIINIIRFILNAPLSSNVGIKLGLSFFPEPFLVGREFYCPITVQQMLIVILSRNELEYLEIFLNSPLVISKEILTHLLSTLDCINAAFSSGLRPKETFSLGLSLRPEKNRPDIREQMAALIREKLASMEPTEECKSAPIEETPAARITGMGLTRRLPLAAAAAARPDSDGSESDYDGAIDTDDFRSDRGLIARLEPSPTRTPRMRAIRGLPEQRSISPALYILAGVVIVVSLLVFLRNNAQ